MCTISGASAGGNSASLFDHQPALTVECHGDLAAHEAAQGDAHQLSSPPGPQTGIGVVAEERLEVGARRNDRRIDRQLTGQLGDPGRDERNGRTHRRRQLADHRPGIATGLVARRTGNGGEQVVGHVAERTLVDAPDVLEVVQPCRASDGEPDECEISEHVTRREVELLGPTGSAARQSLVALGFNSATSFAAGAMLVGFEDTWSRLSPMLILVPAAIGLRGNVISTLGKSITD